MSTDSSARELDCIFNVIKWFGLQAILFFLTPYLWNYEYGVGSIMLILIYTTLYAIYGEYAPKELRFHWSIVPYAVYLIIAILLYIFTESFISSVWTCIFLPLYGFICLLCTKIASKHFRKVRKRYKMGGAMVFCSVLLFLICLKTVSVLWMTKENGGFDSERSDILERRNYLVEKLVTTPQEVLNEMPSSIGPQFQGEWALYSCSMLSASLVNISKLYPETKAENIKYIDKLINIVKSPEIRYYDTMRWGEDPLTSLDGDCSHVSYLSHLAWMICGYKEIGGGTKYDTLLADLCEAMNRRLVVSEGFNLPTYPGEAIYVPDMLVAIVALDKYADMNNGKYRSTVQKWVDKAQSNWIDKETGLLVSFLDDYGDQYEGAPVKGSYSALNCYYLSLIDESFAKSQYEQLKSLFWKDGIIPGLKEYWDRTCYVGMDIDAGPILLQLSPSGTAFMTGAATCYNDDLTRTKILRTAEIAGHTIKLGKKRHYLLANVALVGESIMLAMRTNISDEITE